MPIVELSGKVKKCYICRIDRWVANMNLIYPSVVPAGSATQIFVRILWVPQKQDGTVTLRFKKAREEQASQITFDSPAGSNEKTLSADQQTAFSIYGENSAPNGQSNITLEVIVDDEVIERYPIIVGNPTANIAIKSENGQSDPQRWIPTGLPVKLKAVLSQQRPGTFRWASLNSDELRIDSGADEEVVQFTSVGEGTADRLIFVEFTPQDGGSTALAFLNIHTPTDTGVQVAKWQKNNADIGARVIRQGEIVEVYAEIDNQAISINQHTPVRCAVVVVGQPNRLAYSLLANGARSLASAANTSVQTHNQLSYFHTLTEGEVISDVSTAFRNQHATDYWEKMLIVEQDRESQGKKYTLFCWWKSAVDAPQNNFRFVMQFGQFLQARSSNQISVSQNPVSPVEAPPRMWLDLRGRLIDRHPLVVGPAFTEYLDDIEVEGGGATTRSGFIGIAQLAQAENMIARLKNATATHMQAIKNHLSPTVQTIISQFDAAVPASRFQRRLLVRDLNQLLVGPLLTRLSGFSALSISPDTQALLDMNPVGEHRVRANRKILQGIFATELNLTRDGEFNLQGYFKLGTQTIRLHRDSLGHGIENQNLTLELSGDLQASQTVTVKDGNNVTLLQYTHSGAVAEGDSVECNFNVPVPVLVHKLRGITLWPDTRVVHPAAFTGSPHPGTPVRGKHIYVVALEKNVPIDDQRPGSTQQINQLKTQKHVRQSTQPGRSVHAERTDYSGKYEIKYVDTRVDQRYFIWVESLSENATEETCEAVVRTFHKPLIRLTGGHANNTTDERKQLIDHTYNMSQDRVAWFVDSFKIINRQVAPNNLVPWCVRPHHNHKTAYAELDVIADDNIVSQLDFDASTKIIRDFETHCLPLTSLEEGLDEKHAQVKEGLQGLRAHFDTVFPRGYFYQDIKLIWDAWKFQQSLDFSAEPNTANNPENIPWEEDQLQARKVEVLEKTWVVTPQIPGAHLNNVSQVRWDFDAVSLADFAHINIPAPPAAPCTPSQAAVANSVPDHRQLQNNWVPLLEYVTPRFLGLSLGQRILLAPGHGFHRMGSTARTDSDAHRGSYGSPRGGWNLGTGEDHNTLLTNFFIAKVARKNSMNVVCWREEKDLTRPGVTMPADLTFNESTVPEFLRMWQFNPIYYLGRERSNPLNSLGDVDLQSAISNTFGNNPTLGEVGGDHKSKGITIHTRFARELMSAQPYDIFLGLHTNAATGGARGMLAFYYSIDNTTADASEFNTYSYQYAEHLNAQIEGHAHLMRRHADPREYASFAQGVTEINQTQAHWHSGGADSQQWSRYRQQPTVGAYTEVTFFNRTIPNGYIELAYHDNVDDAGLLKRAWWRRLAGEALCQATELQLRTAPNPTGADQLSAGNVSGPPLPAPMTHGKMVTLLKDMFGPTRRIEALVDDNTAITTANLNAYVRDTVGHTQNQQTNNILDNAVKLIEAACSAYTRRQYVEQLIEKISIIAGYQTPRDNSDIENRIAKTILNDATPATLFRGDKPCTREEAIAFLSRAFGWSGTSLAEVRTHHFPVEPSGESPLFDLLDGSEHLDKFVTKVDMGALFKRLQDADHYIDATTLYRVERLILVDAQGVEWPNTHHVYSLKHNAEVFIQAETSGCPWRCNLESIELTIKRGTDDPVRVPTINMDRHRIVSSASNLVLSDFSSQTLDCVLSIAMPHPDSEHQMDKTVLKSQAISIRVSL